MSVCGPVFVCMHGHMWFVCVHAAQIEFFPLSAILKNELIRSLIEFVLHRRLFFSPPQRESRKG